MEIKEQCGQCEKFELNVQTVIPITRPIELPNTYSAQARKYIWKHTDMMAYALIPRSIEGTTATIDMFLCMDEDLMGEIDLTGYATRFLSEEIIPHWYNISDFSFKAPVLGAPEVLPCWKTQHQQSIEEASLKAAR